MQPTAELEARSGSAELMEVWLQAQPGFTWQVAPLSMHTSPQAMDFSEQTLQHLLSPSARMGMAEHQQRSTLRESVTSKTLAILIEI
jgi:hypothetical protein